MGRGSRWLIAGMAAFSAPAAAQLYSAFADYDVPVYCGIQSTGGWVTTLGVARAPDTGDATLYRELLARTARDALRAQGHAIEGVPNCFFDDPSLPRSSFNRPIDALRAQWQEEARILGNPRSLARLDLPEPVDPATRPRPTPLPGARQRRTIGGPGPAAAIAPPRAVLAPAAAAALLPRAQGEVAPGGDDSVGVQALNNSILAQHAAIEAEARRRREQFAEERRRHAAVVAAAAERDRLYQQEVARLRAAEEQYRRDLAAHEALVRGQSGSRRPPPQQQQPAQAVRSAEPPPASQAAPARQAEWREAVTVCALDASDPQSRFGNWRCVGPGRANYVKVGTETGALDPRALASLGEACGAAPATIRDLGTVGTYRAFGCGYALDPAGAAQADPATRFGLGDIPGRLAYRCPGPDPACQVR